jgi:large subunit ribosomal protein L27
MSKTKTSKTTKGTRKSNPKYLGIKLYGGEKANGGSIIIRQRGSKFLPGPGTGMGRDYSIYAVSAGVVKYYVRAGKQFVSIINAS